MPKLLNPKHNYLNLFLVPLWVGLLALPFTGINRAFRVSASAMLIMLLWRLRRVDAFMAVRSWAAEKLSKAVASFPPITRYASSPLTYVLIVVFVAILPLFLNDYYLDIMTLTGMYILLALGLNIVVGQAGLL